METMRSVESIPRVVLVGSFMCFSNRILAVLRDEFPDFSFERVDEVNLGEAFPKEDLHLVICEEGLISGVLELAATCRTSIAVAFDDAHSVAARLAACGLADWPPGLSLLPMNVRFEAWLSIVRLLLHRETFVPVEVLRWLAGPHEGQATASVAASEAQGGTEPECPDLTFQKLTERERKVLPLVAQGKQNKVIANELKMSEHTVKLHVHHIIGKLGVRNRTEAARFYLSQFTVEGGA